MADALPPAQQIPRMPEGEKKTGMSDNQRRRGCRRKIERKKREKKDRVCHLSQQGPKLSGEMSVLCVCRVLALTVEFPMSKDRVRPRGWPHRWFDSGPQSQITTKNHQNNHLKRFEQSIQFQFRLKKKRSQIPSRQPIHRSAPFIHATSQPHKKALFYMLFVSSS